METMEDRYGKEFSDEIRKAQPMGATFDIWKHLLDRFGRCGIKLTSKQQTLLSKDVQHFTDDMFDKYLGTTYPGLFSKD
ncbi:MAG: hypothetical protein Q9M36_05590 [Sulfurovum sp.]|nr:hypothetical protein [Sulfurovum sp.]